MKNLRILFTSERRGGEGVGMAKGGGGEERRSSTTVGKGGGQQSPRGESVERTSGLDS